MKSTNVWLYMGFFAQLLFFSRFLVQWLISEKQGRSVVPTIFWHISLVGGVLLLIYSIHIKDPVFIVGQSMGVFIYLRNIILIEKQKKRASEQNKRCQIPTVDRKI